MYLYDIEIFHLHREPFFVSRGILACFFLGLGALYWKYEIWFDRVINKYTILLFIALYLYIAYFCPVAPRFLVSMGDMDVLGYFFGFLGSVILIWFCKQLPQIKTLTFIGRNSICFYFMSGALPITLSAIVKRIYPDPSFWGVFLVFGLTLIGAYIASLVIVKYLPWMLDIRKLKKWWKRMWMNTTRWAIWMHSFCGGCVWGWIQVKHEYYNLKNADNTCRPRRNVVKGISFTLIWPLI